MSQNELCAETIMTLAERESGGFGLADAGLCGRVAYMISWINARGPYTPDQTAAMRLQIQHLLANRLSLELDRLRFPQIPQEGIDRPIFVIGFARSGTTLLQCLFAQHPEILTPRAWHSRWISPPPGAGPVAPGRIAYVERQFDQWLDMCPGSLQIHPYADGGAYQTIEDEELFTMDFRNAYPSMLYRVPTLDVMVLLGDDAAEGFQFHRKVLQHLQWNTGHSRWVCKSGSAQGNLEALFEVYPDAICVWAHRPIADIYASNVTARAGSFDAINGGAIDWASQARERAEQMKAGIDKLMASRMIDDPRVIHLPFRELSADPVAAIRRISDRAGIEFTPAFEANMRAWLEDPANRVDRYGRYPYSYEAFGLDKAWIEELFDGYSERFGLKVAA
ncbi:sulfotransferase family protein [Novosphingobium malaysiense]|uniref:sulfotransferase family protein n=1 Tax=Novosphingobium malaysiense TaxID=1348853 RepID=UPI00068CA91A|nr:sulfotransferase [Novosphingobium malaysiense]